MALYNPPLQVVGFHGTRRGETDRGPMIRIRSDDAALRMVTNGEMVWVQGPRRQELAVVLIDDTLPRGGVVVRDITGLAVSEIVRITKPDMDTGPTRGTLA
jgi:hypothetical protein